MVSQVYICRMITARKLQHQVKYARWERFNSLIKRAKNLIANGVAHGEIKEIMVPARLGSGAIRLILDYELDDAAASLARQLALSYKLGSSFCIRNETVILELLRKYCTHKGYSFDFQFPLGGKIYDFRCGKKLIEFDEPHHDSRRHALNDLIKNEIAAQGGFSILRFTLSHDIIDILIALEKDGL